MNTRREENRRGSRPPRERPGTPTCPSVCARCGGSVVGEPPLEEHRLERFGIDGVVLHDAVVLYRCEKCHVVQGQSIPNDMGLIAAVALTRVKLPIRLGHKEVSFLRKALDLTGKELAGELEVKPETVSRWENSEPIGPVYEKLLRLLVCLRLREKAPLIQVDPSVIAAMKTILTEVGTPPIEMHFRAVPADEAVDPDKGRDGKENKNWVKAA